MDRRIRWKIKCGRTCISGNNYRRWSAVVWYMYVRLCRTIKGHFSLSLEKFGPTVGQWDLNDRANTIRANCILLNHRLRTPASLIIRQWDIPIPYWLFHMERFNHGLVPCSRRKGAVLGSPHSYCTLIFDLMRNLYVYNQCMHIYSFYKERSFQSCFQDFCEWSVLSINLH